MQKLRREFRRDGELRARSRTPKHHVPLHCSRRLPARDVSFCGQHRWLSCVRCAWVVLSSLPVLLGGITIHLCAHCRDLLDSASACSPDNTCQTATAVLPTPVFSLPSSHLRILYVRCITQLPPLRSCDDEQRRRSISHVSRLIFTTSIFRVLRAAHLETPLLCAASHGIRDHMAAELGLALLGIVPKTDGCSPYYRTRIASTFVTVDRVPSINPAVGCPVDFRSAPLAFRYALPPLCCLHHFSVSPLRAGGDCPGH
ncbi:hypothetical protein BV25DRAFT_361013 [Artomyces pyxidatus]|uniref:Uncharacterized protein n=1 Tax=Artomyces pyxidatus TaxID=48021 RepID=A0ACB8T4U3_9AGAM|nr:hypothetical protein BV25DRAFT_361013 [Artomyces pyxidatus]